MGPPHFAIFAHKYRGAQFYHSELVQGISQREFRFWRLDTKEIPSSRLDFGDSFDDSSLWRKTLSYKGGVWTKVNYGVSDYDPFIFGHLAALNQGLECLPPENCPIARIWRVVNQTNAWQSRANGYSKSLRIPYYNSVLNLHSRGGLLKFGRRFRTGLLYGYHQCAGAVRWGNRTSSQFVAGTFGNRCWCY